MDKDRALEKVKSAINKIPHLKTLPYDNQNYIKLRDYMLYVLEGGFGKDSMEYKRFNEAASLRDARTDDEKQGQYISNLNNCKAALESILEKNEHQKEMVKPEDLKFYNELQDWFEELKSFQKQLYGGKVTHDELEPMRENLIRRAPRFKQRVIDLTGKQYGEQFGKTFDVWDEALSPYIYDGLNWINRFSLNALVDCINEAIGSLEAGEIVTSIPSRYQFTSPVYWAERLWRWNRVSTIVIWIKTAVSWIKRHLRLAIIIVILTGFIAAIITIWEHFS